MSHWVVEALLYALSLAVALALGVRIGELRAKVTIQALRKKVEESTALLAHSRKVESLGRFAGGIAHDFNNLLTVIQGHAELLATKLTRLGVQGIEIRELSTATSRAAALTRQLLAYSRHRSTQVALWNVSQVVEGMNAMLQSLVGERYELSYHLSPAVPVSIDRSKLEQVILNLVLNARDALGPSGSISIATSAGGLPAGSAPGTPEILLEVADSGAGMDCETTEKIFDPFFTTKEQGTGIGLATVRDIVEEAGGRIEVDSKLGKGTTMRVFFPMAKEVSSQAPAPVARGDDSPQHGRILVVEDEKTVATLVRRILEQAGYTIELVRSADEALTLLENRAAEFDLVLSDVVMRHMSGSELALLIRQRFPALPVLLMSASAQPEKHLNGSGGLVHGDLYLLQKPFSSAVLTEKVRSAIKAHGA